MNEWIVIVYTNSASENTKKSSKHCQKRGSHEENLAQDKRQKGKESKRERERKGTLKVERKGRKGKELGNVDEAS